MSDRRDEAIDLMARAISAVLFVVSPNDLETVFRENVRSRVGKYPDEDWGRVESFLNEAFNHRYVSSIRELALNQDRLVDAPPLAEGDGE